jgi:hypothetical protein
MEMAVPMAGRLAPYFHPLMSSWTGSIKSQVKPFSPGVAPTLLLCPLHPDSLQTCPTKGAGEGSLHALPSLVVSLQLRDSSSISHL